MILLCGLPRIGKTPMGRYFAHKLQRSFVDLDTCCKNVYFSFYKERLSCSEIVKRHQERFFRELESFCLTQLLQHHQLAVVALGGGTLLYPPSASLVQALGVLVHLEVSLTDYLLVKKLRGAPSLLAAMTHSQLQKHVTHRLQLFKRLSDISIPYNPHQGSDETSDNILNILQNKLQTLPGDL